jgi:hypothetical protein
MATFYVLPPRACLDDAVAAFIGELVPGVPAPAWEEFAEHLRHPGVYFVPRDELPDDEPVPATLTADFGAEAGDRVVEVSLGGAARTWVVGGVSGAAAA